MERIEYERELIVRIFQTSNVLQTYLDRILREDQLTAKQFFTMIFIGNIGHDPKISELSEFTHTSHQNTKQVLLKLQKRDYVDIYKDEQDSRVTRVRLTTKAMQYWQQRSNDDLRTIQSLFHTIQDDDLKATLQGLKDITTQLLQLQNE
ncbi:MarR family winged helix-turn-helix transcriptional regulator [Candidatus Xianfuyuplasma coldseepsis]|uniref:Winged helix DNA-binding protein n=1 Tax=Candidatus Xianfuyuplasma coldseepsis TaxID=2782163 RepID=A0A7L7KSK6_9MOLU|nr:winged helix DNA-binding protein [Xianfuyuplasma coldseepsis]QMS85801.1 winged helix DNA-binding protein [Xianfuyuplasma coldseepsis]